VPNTGQSANHQNDKERSAHESSLKGGRLLIVVSTVHPYNNLRNGAQVRAAKDGRLQQSLRQPEVKHRVKIEDFENRLDGARQVSSGHGEGLEGR
jgi:hypothetical protein